MKASIRRRLYRPVCAVLAAVLMASAFVFCYDAGTVSAATSSDIENYKNNANVKKYQQNISDLEKKQEKMKEEIASLKGDIDDWQTKKEYYDELSEICDERIAVSESLKAELEAEIESINDDIMAKTAASDELYDQIKERMVMTYESGGANATYLELLFGAESLVDFMIGIDQATSLIEYDTNLMEEYKAVTAELAEEKAILSSNSEELDSVMASLAEQKAEADTLSEESAELISNAMSTIEARNEVIKDLEAAEDAAAKKLDDYIDELIKKSGTTQSVADGSFMWPLETRYTTITSRFGRREDPFNPGSGIISNHGGTDIYAPQGAKIYASNNGTVVKAERDESYGNYIMIDHGGGIYSLYAHCSKLLVKEGTYVTKGTVIAEVGHTGHATGNHLHFEFREGKTRVDALNYVKIPK